MTEHESHDNAETEIEQCTQTRRAEVDLCVALCDRSLVVHAELRSRPRGQSRLLDKFSEPVFGRTALRASR